MAHIPPDRVSEMDQEYAKAKKNLDLHIEDFRAKLDAGDAPETVVLGCAIELMKSRPNTHLAFMLAAAVMALTERHARTERMHEFRFRAGFRATVIRHQHNDCEWFQAVHNDLEPDFTKLLVLAELHVRECEK